MNGKGKEYDEYGELLFEGEYVNGKIWNGKIYNIKGNIECEIKDGKGHIKEYDKNGELLFEGEYLNGERKGKGKEYDRYGELLFEGSYLNGERNGKGKEYDEDGKILFEGDYLNGKRWNGYESEYDMGGPIDSSVVEEFLSSEKEYLNGKKTGKVYKYDYDGYCYNEDEFEKKEYMGWYGGRRCPKGRGRKVWGRESDRDNDDELEYEEHGASSDSDDDDDDDELEYEEY